MKGLDKWFQVMFDYIETIYVLTEEDKKSCRYHMQPLSLSKDDYLSTEGKIPRYHHFIVSGHVRNFHFDQNGNDVTMDLNDGPRFFTSFTHFFNRTISNENLQCVTDCEILRVHRDVMEEMSKAFPSMNEYMTLVLQESWANEKQRILERTTLSAEQRYLKLLNEKPLLIKNYPLVHIASYLGIRPGSLSRIRKELSAKKCV